MFDTNRRSKISTSELGLYSDRSERRHGSGYGTVVIKQFVVVVMIIITIALIVFYVYDVTSSTSVLHKPNFDVKNLHIYRTNFGRANTTLPSISGLATSPENDVQTASSLVMQDRSDTFDCDEVFDEDLSLDQKMDNENFQLEPRVQNLNNFQFKEKMLKQMEAKREGKHEEHENFDNHAMVYRIRPSSKRMMVVDDKDDAFDEDNSDAYNLDYKTPYPSSFKRLKYPQLSQYRYPHSSRNIQDVIKYMVNDPANLHRAVKFSGVYLNSKNFDEAEDTEEMLEEETNTQISVANSVTDPLMRYKPKSPADVNLLASSNLRFSPMGIQRFNHYNIEPPYHPHFRPSIPYLKPYPGEMDTIGSYSSNNFNNFQNLNNVNAIKSAKRKPKPFSVMLDIYPMTEISEYQSKNTMASRPRLPMNFEDYEWRKPMQYMPRFPKSQPLPLVLPNKQRFRDEEEKQQLILHLNLYPRKKGKSSRYDILQQTENRLSMDKPSDSRSVVSPFQMITKQLADHFAIENAKQDVNGTTENPVSNSPEDVDGTRKMRLYQQLARNYVLDQDDDNTAMATICKRCLDSTTQYANSSTKDNERN